MDAKKLDALYAKYVKARAKAWAVHDSLSKQNKFSRNHPAYVKACNAEHTAWTKYLDARGSD